MTSVSQINKFIDYLVKTKKSSVNTVSAYERDLEGFNIYLMAESKDILDVSGDDIDRYKSAMNSKGFSPSSVSRAMSSIRGFYKYLTFSGDIKKDPSSKVKNEKIEKKDFAILTSKEVELLLAQPDIKTIKGLRDKAMLEVMYATGLKVTELISLKVSDINTKLGFVVCHGDDGKKSDRTIFLYPAAVKSVKEYLDTARKILNTEDSDDLFLNINGFGITRQGFWKILKAYVESAGINKTITPHTLRHSFATHLLENGADINDIKEILGHSDIASTQVYANYIKGKIKDSYLKFHPRA